MNPSLSASIFYTKIYKHEEKHDVDLKDSSYVEQFISSSTFEQEMQSRGLMSESSTPAITNNQLYQEAVLAGEAIWAILVHDLEDRAYAISDPEWPSVLYMSYNQEY